jgi:hypothetical protein
MYAHCHISISIHILLLTIPILQVQKVLLAEGTKAVVYHGKMGKKRKNYFPHVCTWSTNQSFHLFPIITYL